ncbi:MAG TPA: hypothetical protein EYH03_07205 [Chromatiales bacterium]|nr:hypothetical protein [Chromatiales bacterium]
MYPFALTLHLLATIVWVGGMFFAHMALRPAAEALFEPPQRLPLMHAVLTRFFRWVWAALIVILLSGYWIFFGVYNAQTAGYVHLMQAIGWLMAALFAYIYFVPYRGLGRALEAGELPAAGASLAVIRRIIVINLSLGIVEAVLGAARPF